MELRIHLFYFVNILPANTFQSIRKSFKILPHLLSVLGNDYDGPISNNLALSYYFLDIKAFLNPNACQGTRKGNNRQHKKHSFLGIRVEGATERHLQT